MSISYFWVFILLLTAGTPVVFALLIGPGVSLMLDGNQVFFSALLTRLYSGMNSFPLMAVPFFILAGELMNQGGITQSIVRFSQTLIGHYRGGLAQVNILSSVLFAGLSGSAVADTSALGKMLIPAMEENGYSRRFAAAVTAASSVIGPIIPPSGIMILYAFIMNVSVAGMFLAGITPGLLICAGLMIVTSRISKKRNYPVANKKATWYERGSAFKKSFLPLLTPVILLGGIVLGVFTPTEAAAAAAGYALIITLFVTNTLKFDKLPHILVNAAVQSGTILLLVGSAVTFAWIITVSGMADMLAANIVGITDNVLLLLLIINLFLFAIGMFLDAGPAILILGPVLAPIFISLGIDPLHFAVIMCVNLTVGLATPPMGLVLFVAASVSGEKTENIAYEMLPFLAVEALVIFIITYFPAVTMTLPRLFGFA
ncbi:TRAP transporter large permease [Paraglaciecola polaris]|uniref:TRAP transporter large permease protein n=1 Tax=Paraglaciecola polaris LMG 21857 TaxID=1129793 RepID=K6YFW5_9ALTE|nr:TRAP transporter large permease [Paraglaciecola polaris]GAC31629.1 TRAP dicarboxylate transporter [Paraglaciecola polaris LMG 21857]|tara:strand:+ start:52570 stop:53856 length:1287 start_codon:yes stop_codon:yes gene_type:complete